MHSVNTGVLARCTRSSCVLTPSAGDKGTNRKGLCHGAALLVPKSALQPRVGLFPKFPPQLAAPAWPGETVRARRSRLCVLLPPGLAAQSPSLCALGRWYPFSPPRTLGQGSTSSLCHCGPLGSQCAGQVDITHPRCHSQQQPAFQEPPVQNAPAALVSILEGSTPQLPQVGPSLTVTRARPRG